VISGDTTTATSNIDQSKILQETRVLLDILVHDLLNYNQIARLSADLISQYETNNQDFQTHVKQLISAIDGSSLLLRRAARLGKVLTETNPKLFGVDLAAIVLKSLDLIKNATPQREVVLTRNYPVELQAFVNADDLLDEVFTNIFSNSVRYTDGEVVRVDVAIESDQQFWKVSITDQGCGIDDELKSRLFARYLKGARGSGLGLSIVHSLVVDR
jgi:signal transduction histidine kinase